MLFDFMVGFGEIFIFMLIDKTFRKNSTKKHIFFAIIFAFIALLYTLIFLFVLYAAINSRSIKIIFACVILFLGYIGYGLEIVEKCRSNKKK